MGLWGRGLVDGNFRWSFSGVGLGTRRFGSGMGHGILMGGMDLDLDMGIFSGVGVCFAVGGGGVDGMRSMGWSYLVIPGGGLGGCMYIATRESTTSILKHVAWW